MVFAVTPPKLSILEFEVFIYWNWKSCSIKTPIKKYILNRFTANLKVTAEVTLNNIVVKQTFGSIEKLLLMQLACTFIQLLPTV